MNYHRLGKTSLQVSCLSIGTVELGIDYGIPSPANYGRPARREAIALIRAASASGINLFDTAPAYGESESLLGETLGSRSDVYIATKVSVPKNSAGNLMHGKSLRQTLLESIETSLHRLKRDYLDIVQIHNATVEVIERGEIAEILKHAQQEGKVRFLGASVYTEEEALAVIETKCFDTLQIAYNILDQRMAKRIFPAAQAMDTGVICRSALLKGALTIKAQWLPPELTDLREAVAKVMEITGGSWETLPEIALRFCLSNQSVGTVLVGASTQNELRQAVHAAETGPLPGDLTSRMQALAHAEDRLLNPVHWPLA
jgi:aryl-alcohol dehydrogenase-like predicted oxidoreductase